MVCTADLDLRALRSARARGRWQKNKSTQLKSRGRHIRCVPWRRGLPLNELALTQTLLAASVTPAPIIPVSLENLRFKVRKSERRRVIIFVVDASGSMKSKERMGAAKGAVLGLLTSAYQSRDRVGLIVFREEGARVVLSPTKSVERAKQQLRKITVGGSSPLAAGLMSGLFLLRKNRAKTEAGDTVLVIISDGEANVSMSTTSAIEEELSTVASRIREESVQTVVIDTKSGPIGLRFMRKLAKVLNADYHHISSFSAGKFVAAINK